MDHSFYYSIRFNFLYIDRYSFLRTWVYPRSRLPYHILRYIVKGRASFFIDGEEVLVEEGDIVYLPQGCTLSCHALEEDLRFYSIRFTASVRMDGGDLLSEYYHVPGVTRDSGKFGRRLFDEMYHWVHTEEISRMFWIQGYLDLLIGYVIHSKAPLPEQETLRSEAAEEYNLEKIRRRIRKSDVKIDSRIQVVADYMALHPYEPYSIKRMQEMAELGETRFRQLFKQQMGKNPLEYLTELRVMGAARKLLVSNGRVSDIAYGAGFEDVNHFIKTFKRYFGVTPNQYRIHAKE